MLKVKNWCFIIMNKVFFFGFWFLKFIYDGYLWFWYARMMVVCGDRWKLSKRVERNRDEDGREYEIDIQYGEKWKEILRRERWL